jgi:sn-glycerol 3-phosphate transport system ATP-binding protein
VAAEIALDRVSKHWGGTRAVDDISFEVPANRFVVLLGPSGCGKSTTLRLIAGLEEVTAGRILIHGADVTALPPSSRRLSMVFQSYALFPHLSVAENIVFGLKVRRVDPAARRVRLARVAALVGLSDLLERKPAQLSGGQPGRHAGPSGRRRCSPPRSGAETARRTGTPSRADATRGAAKSHRRHE